MKYELKQIFCRPWTLNGFTLQLIESHYENNYGGALRKLNAVSAQLEGLDPATAAPYLLASLKREQMSALNSTLLHELYFASMAGLDSRPTKELSEALAWPSETEMLMPEYVATSVASGVPLSRPVDALKLAHAGRLETENVSVSRVG